MWFNYIDLLILVQFCLKVFGMSHYHKGTIIQDWLKEILTYEERRKKKKKKTKESVTEDITNDSCFALILSPKGWPIRAIDVRLHHVQKSPVERFTFAKSLNLQWKNIYTNRYTNIFKYLQKKKTVTIFKLHGDQKEKKKSGLRTESPFTSRNHNQTDHKYLKSFWFSFVSWRLLRGHGIRMSEIRLFKSLSSFVIRHFEKSIRNIWICINTENNPTILYPYGSGFFFFNQNQHLLFGPHTDLA